MSKNETGECLVTEVKGRIFWADEVLYNVERI